MKPRNTVSCALLGAAVLAACGTDERAFDLESDESTLALQLVETTTLAAGAECAAGGRRILTGLDENKNGILDAGEVDSSINVCNGADDVGTDGTNGQDGQNGENGQNGVDGQNGIDGLNLLSTTAVASLSVCAEGGVIVHFGLDENRNGSLDSSEIEGSTTVCSGISAETSCPTLLRVTPENDPLVCPHGGVTVAYGTDNGTLGAGGASPAESCDGILSASEEAGSTLICNGSPGLNGEPGEQGETGDPGNPGVPGTDGSDGLNHLIKVTVEPDASNCPGGGFFVEYGYDDNLNGILDASETDHSTYFCTDDGDGDGVFVSIDNCPDDYNPSQIDQDGDGAGDVCDPTPCPPGGCLDNCTELINAGYSESGRYSIDPSGSSPVLVECDMTTDGGGWTLVLNYSHSGGTNPVLDVRTSDLPLLKPGTVLGDNQAGTEFWGHASPALFASLNAEESRFYAVTSNHGRVIHFKSSSCNDYFGSGAGSCAGINTNHVELAGHSANLPDSVANYYINQGDQAMTNFPYWLSGTYHWGVRGNTNRWEVDNYPNNSNHNTWHQIWVRSETAVDAGCADGTREGFTDLATYPNIAACDGGFSVAGVRPAAAPACRRRAGDDGTNPNGTGCNVADFCAAGWHVCDDPADVVASNATGCQGVGAGANRFYTTRQSGTGSNVCSDEGLNDIFGCGTLGYANHASCVPLLNAGNVCGNLVGTPWSCGANGVQEAANVTKSGPAGGGVLCCRD